MSTKTNLLSLKYLMKKMLFTTVSSIVLLTIFTNCGSAQKKASESVSFEEKTPFSIKSASYQTIVGGIPGTNQTHLTIKIASKPSATIVFDSIYFTTEAQAIKTLTSGDRILLSASFTSTKPHKRDVIMDADPKKEMSNKVLPIRSKIPFKLSDNECVISYIINGKKKYYKIKNMKKGKTLYRQ